MAILKRTLRNAILATFIMAVIISFCSVAYAAAVQLQEGKIKAGLLYNFLKYTSWPGESEGQTIHVCLVGGDSFDGALYPLSGRTAQRRVIAVQEVEPFEIEQCNLVFIHQSAQNDMEDVLANLRGRSILTLSDAQNFSRQGGMVEFARGTDHRIHLVINNHNIEKSGLRVEERLLKLAERVD